MLNLYLKQTKVIILSFTLVLFISNLNLYAYQPLSEHELLQTFNNESNSSMLLGTAEILGNDQDKKIEAFIAFSNIALEEFIKENTSKSPEYGLVYKYNHSIAQPLRITQSTIYEYGSSLLVKDGNSMKLLNIITNAKYADNSLLSGGYYAYAGVRNYTTLGGEKQIAHVFVELSTQ